MAVAASATAGAISIISSNEVHSSPRRISSSGLHSPPRSIISSSGPHSPPRSISSSSHRSSSSSSSDHQDITLAGGTIACLFPLRPARTLLCRVSSDTPRAAEHVPPSASVHCAAGDPHANYSSNSPGDYASCLGGDYGLPQQQQMPSPPVLHKPPVLSDSSWNSSTDRTVMTQFCLSGESVSSSGILSNSSTRRVSASVPRPFSSNYLPSAFAALSKDNSSDVWIGDGSASCHMTNDASKI